MMLRQIFLVLFHQLLCHGSWSLKPPPLNQTFLPDQGLNQSQSHQVTATLSPTTIGNQILSIETNCSRDVFEIKMELIKKFRGILFAKDFLEECRTRGSKANQVTLKIPTSGCGVRSEMKGDGSLELSVKVMLQMDGKLRQRSDIEKIVECVLPGNMMNIYVLDNADGKKMARNGRMRFDTSTHVKLSPPRVRVWLELGGSDGKGTVEVGEATTLSVRAIVPKTIGLRVIDCAALDGLGETSQKLLDERGCPIDEQVMPALHERSRPVKEDWSKSLEDDIVEQLFSATFPAFKFPDRERLHVSCGVQLCKGKCPQVNCQSGESLYLSPERQLARIEVFNSLAVTAPQIEIDRLRSDRRYNMSVEEYPPKVTTHSDGTLCLSVSKLAIAFCVLGIIFLVAVIISVCCLIRSRSRRNVESLRPSNTSMFSSSSDSQSRFGSKLLIPYGTSGSLPYGRVY